MRLSPEKRHTSPGELALVFLFPCLLSFGSAAQLPRPVMDRQSQPQGRVSMERLGCICSSAVVRFPLGFLAKQRSAQRACG